GTWSRDRDCLWNIAKKPDIYGDAFKWPKIWQNNRDQIKNPDIIHPGQVLKIPAPAPLTPEEETAARRYYRQKREAEMGGDTESGSSPENIVR
ncbi:MAG: LysM peptidoglycan-binding domain-containing protein, partial [Bacteroidetes bacterium]|nr:LysM peptidoglycan-binding domain-containing protein [Bacteroidota bacterium]